MLIPSESDSCLLTWPRRHSLASLPFSSKVLAKRYRLVPLELLDLGSNPTSSLPPWDHGFRTSKDRPEEGLAGEVALLDASFDS